MKTRLCPTIKKGHECPYLDTINRRVLNFDFEKCCTVSLSRVNVYVCLVCGIYFQGRGNNTHAHIHCLEFDHHVFMRLEDGSFWCLPDCYKIEDRTLDDIHAFFNPTFSDQDIEQLDKSNSWSRALDGVEYMPGMVGLNNMGKNDYVNVIIQIVARVKPIRNFFLNINNYLDNRSVLIHKTGELLRKIWHPNQFKCQVSPHDFMQAVITESKRTFLNDKQGDPLTFLMWLLNTFHRLLTSGRIRDHSIITQTFQGELEVWVKKGTNQDSDSSTHSQEEKIYRVPFLVLSLDLPPAPVFKDTFDKMQIPQIPLFLLLKKYDGVSLHEDFRTGYRRYRITRLPNYLLLSFRRYTKNNFFWEKNPSIVNFPIRNLNIKDAIPLQNEEDASTSYNLIASVTHNGKADESTYKVYVHRLVENLWYEIQDLSVIEVLPQMVALSEAYIQVYER